MTTARIVVGGILAVPAFLLHILVVPLIGIVSLPTLALLLFRKNQTNHETNNIDNHHHNQNNHNHDSIHVIVTGGTSGIGLAVAQECVTRRVATRLTLLARNLDKLEQVQKDLMMMSLLLLSQQNKDNDASTNNTSRVAIVIDVVSVDVTDPQAVDVVAKQVCGTNNNNKTKTTIYLFNCAGIAYPGYFSELDKELFAKTANLNLMGTLYTTHAFLPYMTASSSAHGGTVVLTSSMGGQCGAFGYTAYAPTKAALKGFAEALHMELVNSPVNVQIVFPPDTDTPGYAQENKTKPKECFLISEAVGLYQPDVVGKVMVREAMRRNPRFMVYYGLDGWVLSTMTAGFGPETSLLDALSQVTLTGAFRLLSFFYLNDFWRIIRKCAAEHGDDETKNGYGSIKAD